MLSVFLNEFEGHYRRLSHGPLICLLEARFMLWGFIPLFRIMNLGVCTMSWFADYVMWPGPFEQTFVPPSHRGSTWNLTSICPVVSKEKRFENTDRPQTTTTETTHTISSPVGQRLSWAKISVQKTTIFFLFLNNWVLSVYRAIWFLRRFLKRFYHGSHLGHVTLTIWTNFCSSIP